MGRASRTADANRARLFANGLSRRGGGFAPLRGGHGPGSRRRARRARSASRWRRKPVDRADPVEHLDERGQVVDGQLGRGAPGPGAVEDPLDPDALQLAEVGEGEEDHERERPGRVGQVDDQRLVLVHRAADGLEAGPEAGLGVAVGERDHGLVARPGLARGEDHHLVGSEEDDQGAGDGQGRAGPVVADPDRLRRRAGGRREGQELRHRPAQGMQRRRPPRSTTRCSETDSPQASQTTERWICAGSGWQPARPGSRRRGRRPAPRGSRRRRPGGDGRTRSARPGSPCRPGRARGGRRSRGRSGRSRSPAGSRRGRRARLARS